MLKDNTSVYKVDLLNFDQLGFEVSWKKIVIESSVTKPDISFWVRSNEGKNSFVKINEYIPSGSLERFIKEIPRIIHSKGYGPVDYEYKEHPFDVQMVVCK